MTKRAEYKKIVSKISIPANHKIKQKAYLQSGTLPVIDQGQELVGGYTNDCQKQIVCDLPVIVFGDHTKNVKYINFPFCAGADGIKILKAKDDIFPKYLYYGTKFLTFCIEDKGYARHYQHIEKQELSVPPLPEQERIVAKIEELFSQLDAAVAELKSVKEKLVIYRQAVLKEAFEGKISSRNKYDYVLDNQFRKISSRELEKLSPIPEHWRYVYLSDLGELARGKSKHRPRNDSRLFENGKYPFFQTGDVKSAQKELIECEKKYGDFGLAQSKLWPQGTLCITIAANIAETCFLGVDACFPDSIVGFTPNEAIVDKAYVRWFIEISKAQLWAFAPATAQKNINLTTLENLIVPYCSLKEQKIIVQDIEEKISVCNNIEQTVDTALQQAAALRQNILKQAFEGDF